jgi:hypothetical protein
MTKVCRALPFFIVLALGASAVAQERQPFHIAQSNDNTIITLAIRMSQASVDLQYDFDVEVEVTKDTVGTPIYVDDWLHLVRIRCRTPRAVKVGDALYSLPTMPRPGDWKEDLWLTICLPPIS